MIAFFGIRQISTGNFLPNYGSRKGRGGWTNDEPQSLTDVAPRLFTKKVAAAAALREWLKGVTRVEVHRSRTWSGDEDDSEEFKVTPMSHRKADDMEIVAVFVEVWQMTSSGIPTLMTTIAKHFVTFFSPGTFVAEHSGKEVDAWNVDLACELAHGIVERYGATPYAFYFTTRGRGPADLDSKEIARSPTYYLGGKVETLAEIKTRNSLDDQILISNMESNGCPVVIVNTNSWRWTQALQPTDIILDWTPRKKQEKTNGSH